MKLLRKISINFQSTFSSASLSWLLKLPNIQYLRHYVAQSNNRWLRCELVTFEVVRASLFGPKNLVFTTPIPEVFLPDEMSFF